MNPRRLAAALGLTLGLAALPAGPAAALAPGWKAHALFPGTAFATWYYVFDSGLPGPRVLLFAPHGDERSAGWNLWTMVNHKRPNKGFYMVCAVPLAPAWNADTRHVVEDPNRQFDPGADDNTPSDLLAHQVRRWILDNKIDLVLNMHEGWYKYHEKWKEYGECFFIDAAALAPVAQRVATRVNARIQADNRFMVAYKPMGDTLSFWCFSKGIKAVGCEVTRELPWPQKLTYQAIIIEEWLREYGVVLR